MIPIIGLLLVDHEADGKSAEIHVMILTLKAILKGEMKERNDRNELDSWGGNGIIIQIGIGIDRSAGTGLGSLKAGSVYFGGPWFLKVFNTTSHPLQYIAN